MTFMNTLTDAIANPKRVRASQERASERFYSGLEAKMSSIRDTSPEITPPSPSVNALSFSSRIPPGERSGQQTLRRPELHRSQSDLPVASGRQPRPEPRFTPCITAMDLTADQLKKNYSHDDLQKWDKVKHPLPPISAMQGNFRYRTAANADAEWRNEHFKKQIHSLNGFGSVIAGLDMEDMTGIPNDEWSVLASGSDFRGSAISSGSTRTDSTSSLQTTAIDQESGAKIFRGFSPSQSPSTRSSFHSRKSSSLSIMNLASEMDDSPFQKPMLRHLTTSASDRRLSGPLSTIKELPNNAFGGEVISNKTERPCEFTVEGDPESAVASDAEGDDGDEAWCDITEMQPTRVSAITQMLKEGKKPESPIGLIRVRTNSSEKKRCRGITTSMERTKTIRASRAHTNRPKSRTKSVTHERTHSDEQNEKEIRSHATLASPESTTLEGSQELTMHVRKPARNLNAEESQPTESNKTDEDTLNAENQLIYLPRAPRYRSSTAVHQPAKGQSLMQLS